MKRITVKRFTLCLFLLLSCLIAKTQVVSCYFSDNYVADAGSSFTADIQVDSFINLGSSALSVNWDPEVLKFTEVSNLGVTLNELSGINESEAVSDGKLGFVWLNSSASTGVTLPDSTVLFSITFEVVGNGGDTTSLRFTDDPVIREFSNLQPALVPSTYTDALITVTGTSDAYYNSAPEIVNLYPPVPNPFYDNTLVKIDLEQAAQTTIKIIDQTGRVLYEDQQFFAAGLQNIPISKEIFKHSGTYYCLLSANEFRIMQKLVFIDR